MAISVNHRSAEKELARAWSSVDDQSIDPPLKLKSLIQFVMSSSSVTYKYILVTGTLAKLVEPRIHTRAIQTSSGLKEAYDARSLCHGVVVGFEKSKGNLFGLSNEPFVSKPARHPEHDKTNLQLRDKKGAAGLHDALEIVNMGTPQQIFAALVYILRLGKMCSENEKAAVITQKTNLKEMLSFIDLLLADADGGARLVAVWGAFAELLSHGEEVRVYQTSQADKYAKTTGDVEKLYEKKVVSASECKHRPLTADDVRHGIRKALQAGVPEYLFVCAAGIHAGQEDDVKAAIAESSSKLDTVVIDIWREAPILAALLDPKRRSQFGDTIVRMLRQMRKFETANSAADLWNKLTS